MRKIIAITIFISLFTYSAFAQVVLHNIKTGNTTESTPANAMKDANGVYMKDALGEYLIGA